MSEKLGNPKGHKIELSDLSEEELLALLDSEDLEEDADMSDYPTFEETAPAGLRYRGIKVYKKLKEPELNLPTSMPEYTPYEYYVLKWLVGNRIRPGTERVVPRSYLWSAFDDWFRVTVGRTNYDLFLEKKEQFYGMIKKFFPTGFTHITKYDTKKRNDDSLPLINQRWDVGVDLSNSTYTYEALVRANFPKLSDEEIERKIQKQEEEAAIAEEWRRQRYEKAKNREQWRRNMQIHEERQRKKAEWKAKAEARYAAQGRVAPWIEQEKKRKESGGTD